MSPLKTEFQFDWVIKKPGIITSGVTYSMVAHIKNHKLYLIKVGPGDHKMFMKAKTLTEQRYFDNIRNQITAKATKNQKRLAEIGPQEMSKEKGSFEFNFLEIENFDYSEKSTHLSGFNVLKFKAGKQEMTLEIKEEYEGELKTIKKSIEGAKWTKWSKAPQSIKYEGEKIIVTRELDEILLGKGQVTQAIVDANEFYALDDRGKRVYEVRYDEIERIDRSAAQVGLYRIIRPNEEYKDNWSFGWWEHANQMIDEIVKRAGLIEKERTEKVRFDDVQVTYYARE